jgi:hypothetical protein
VCLAVKPCDIDWHGLRMTRNVARQMGEALIEAAGQPEPRSNSAEAAAAAEFAPPILKPSGRML